MKVSIHLDDVSPDEASKIVGFLAGGAGELKPLTVVKGGKEEKKPEAKAETKPEPKKAAPPPVKAQEAPAPEPEEEEEDDTKESPPPEPEAKEEAKKAAPAKKPAAASSDMPQELLNATRLRDVLDFLIQEGIASTVPELVEKCVELQNEVPVLRKVANIKDRVERAAAVLNITQKSA